MPSAESFCDSSTSFIFKRKASICSWVLACASSISLRTVVCASSTCCLAFSLASLISSLALSCWILEAFSALAICRSIALRTSSLST